MNRISWRETLTRFSLAAVVVLGASRAMAAPIVTVDISTVTAGTGYDSYTFTGAGTPNPDGTTFDVHDTGYGTNFNCIWDVTVNPDPSITALFTLVNLSAFSQSFVLTVTLPVAPALTAPTRMGGSVGQVDFSDFNGNGAPGVVQDGQVELMTVGLNALYRAQIDSTDVTGGNLYGSFDSGLLCCGNGIAGSASLIAFGAPIPSAVGPAVNTNMAIRLQFNLTGGDKVKIPAFFRVERDPVPEPGTALLVGLFAAALVAARVRRD